MATYLKHCFGYFGEYRMMTLQGITQKPLKQLFSNYEFAHLDELTNEMKHGVEPLVRNVVNRNSTSEGTAS